MEEVVDRSGDATAECPSCHRVFYTDEKRIVCSNCGTVFRKRNPALLEAAWSKESEAAYNEASADEPKPKRGKAKKSATE